MVHSAVAEDNLLRYIQKLAVPETCTVGLILGQPSSFRDYIIHFAKTPPCEDDGKDNEKLKIIKNIGDILDVWVADHAKHATRMLPGGMYVLGIFVVSQEDVLTPFSSKLKSMLNQMHKQLSDNSYIHGNPTCTEKLVFNYCSKTHAYSCKTYDIATSSLKPAEIKFQTKSTKWKQFECKFELDQIYPIGENGRDLSLKRQMNDIMELIAQSLKMAIFAFDGEVIPEDDSVEVLDKRKGQNNKNTKDVSASVAIYLPCDCKDVSPSVDLLNSGGHIKLTGQVASKVWIHPKATVGTVCQAIREDLIRSLAARLEMHWDSLIEEEHGSPEDTNSIHEPPRRVLVHLPHTDVTLSDYLFPGEGPQEAQISLQELLDITITEKDAIKDIEGQADLIDMYNSNLESENHEGLQKLPADTNKFMYILGLGIAFLVLITSLIVHFFMNNS